MITDTTAASQYRNERDAQATAFLKDPIALAATLIFVAAALRFFNYCEDDVFIPMRYALNFWHGHGWVMNVGERVDGCTSPLQLWLTTLLLRYASPDQTLFALKALGIVLGIAVMARSRSLAPLLLPEGSRLWRLTPLLLALQPCFTLSMINGLETSLAAFFLLSGLLAITRAFEAEGRYDRRASIREHLARVSQSGGSMLGRSELWFCAAALTRPELALTFPAILILSARRRGGIDWRGLFVYLAPLAAVCAFRYHYYGDWLPNTYYAKHLSLHWGLQLGIRYILNYGFVGQPVLWIPLLVVGYVWLARNVRDAIPVLVTLSIHILFLLRSGGDWMIDGRFCMIVAPIVAVVFLSGIHALWSLGDTLSIRSRVIGWAVPIVVVSLFAVTAAVDVGNSAIGLSRMKTLRGIDYVVQPHAPFERWMGSSRFGRLVMARWIGRHARSGQTVLVGEVGIVPISNMGVKFIDICGLTDATIARMPGYPRGRGGVGGGKMWMHPDGALPRYIHKRRPEWVALLWSPDGKHLEGSRDSDSLYVPAGVFPIQLDGYVQYIATWRRRDVRVR
jgi:hypothetical protein